MRARRTLSALILGVICIGARFSSAVEPGIDAGEVRPLLPPAMSSDEAERDRFDLPALTPETGEEQGIGAGLVFTVARFDVLGSSVFAEAELAEVLAQWTGRPIASEGLLEARDALTRLYVDRGYATSGAIVPDQDVEGGIVRLRVIEGRLAEIEVRGNRRFRDAYFIRRLELAAAAPVSVPAIERILRTLQRNPWIERVDVALEPGEQLGESRLVLAVTERPQWRASFEAANDRSPAVGSAGGIFDGRLANIAGLGDVVSTRFQATKGLIDFDGRLEIPVTRWDTRLRIRARVTETELQEAPFDALEIKASSRTYGISIFQPVHRSEADEVWFELTGEWRETKSTILGESFCFELVLPDCDRPVVSALRAAAQWTRRTQSDVVSMRTQFSFGLDVLRATVGGPDRAPDGEFFAWLGQAQWVHVFPERWWGTQLFLRGDVQLADDPLLSIEKIAVGGRRTVRGYRENFLVRDNAVMLSGELRIPVWRDSLRRPLVEVVPFMDWAHAWNKGPEPPRDEIWSLGLGVRTWLRRGVLAEVYWGGRLKDGVNPRNAPQDYGFHMRIRIDAPEVF